MFLNLNIRSKFGASDVGQKKLFKSIIFFLTFEDKCWIFTSFTNPDHKLILDFDHSQDKDLLNMTEHKS